MSGQERRRGWPQWRGEDVRGAPGDPDSRGDVAPSSGAIAGPAYARGAPDDGWRVREPQADDWRAREADWEAQVPQLERLHALSRRLLELHDETALMRETMQTAAELIRAQAATAQLRAGSGLRLVAAGGLPDESMDPYRFVDTNGISTCAAALRERRRVLVVNFDFAPGFAAFAREAAAFHLRAAVSTPVMDESGEVAAMFTLYFDRPFQPSARELRMLDLCAQQVAPQLSRVQLAAELHDSVGLNRVLMESGADCIQMLDLQGRVLSINVQGRRVLGLDERTQVVEGRFLHELMDPECRAQVEAAIAAGRAGIPQKLETSGRAANGLPRWWSSSLSLIPDTQGRTARLLLVSRDATAQKRDEHTLAEEKRVLDMVSAGRPLSECLDALTGLVSRLDPSAHASVLTADETTGGFAGGKFVPDARAPDASAGMPSLMPGPAFPLPAPASHSEAIFVRGKRAGSFLIDIDRPGTADAWHRRIATFVAHIAGVMLERDCDISEREQAQRRMLDSVNHERAVREDAERLARDSQWLAAIVQSSPDAIISKDLDGIISSWNEGAERLFGYTAAEAIGQPVTLLMPADRAGEEAGILARIRNGEVVDHYETVRRHKNGSLLDISLTVAPIRNARGDIIGGSKIARDIGARKQIERERAEALERERTARGRAEQLARDSAWLAAIVSSSHDAIIGRDLADTITSWNKGAEELFGYTAEEAVGQPGTMLVPAERVSEEPGIVERLRAGELIDRYETEYRRKDGGSVDISLTIAPIRDARGEVAGVSMIARDITLRKTVEREREAALASEQEARLEAETLLEASRILASGRELDELVQKVTDLAAQLIGAEYGAFFHNTSNDRDESYTLYTPPGVDDAQFDGMPVPPDTSGFGAVFAGEAVVRIGDMTKHPEFGEGAPWRDLPVRSYLAVPVVSARNGKVHGGLFFAHSACDRFDERAERLMQGIASQAAIALDNVQAYRDVSLSEAHLRQIIDAMPAAIYTTDEQGRLTHFNAAAAEFAGGEPELGSDTWSASWKLYDADGLPLPLEQFPMARAFTGERPIICGVEAIAERADGTRRWFIPFPTPLRDEQGKLVGGVNMLVDITDRKRAETELVHAHARTESQRRLYDAILSNTLDLIYVFDLDHRFIYANDAQLTMWGKSREEALGKNYLELGYPGWHAAMHDRELDQVMASKRPLRGEVPFTGAFGRRIYEYVFVPVLGPDERVEAVAGTSRDITEQKEIEHRQRFLLDLSDRLRLLDDADAIRHVASETLARELGVSAAGFVEIEPSGDTLIAGGEFCDGRMPDISGRRFSESGVSSGYAPLVLASENIFIEDYEADMRRAGNLEPGRELGLCSGAGVALYNQGKRAAYMYLMHPQPRTWPEADRQLVREVAERAWSAVERVRAVEAMRRSEAELAGELGDMQLLASVGAEMVQEPDANTLFLRIVETAAMLMRAECATMQVLDHDRGELNLRAHVGLSEETRENLEWLSGDSRLPCAVALRRSERVIVGDVRKDEELVGSAELALMEREGINAVQSTPLVARSGRMVGMLSTYWRQRHVPDERRLALLDLLARQAADLVENRRHEQKLLELNAFLERRVIERTADLERSEQQVRRMASMLTMAEHAERRRISQVLHDDLQQQLHSIQMKLSAARSAIGQGKFESAIRHLEAAENWSGEGVDTARRLTVDLSPPILKSEGLAESLEWLVSQMRKMHGLDVILAGERELQLHDDAKRVLVYQVVRELLFNVVKYANTDSARIELRRGNDNLEMRVVDEGVGFDPQKLRYEPKPGGGGFGLASASERLALVGGHLDIESAPGFGTCITLHVPLDGIPRQEPAGGAAQAPPQASGPGIDMLRIDTQDPDQERGWIS
ncbi:MAG TPA: PAS domain S-box protein [Rhodanobacteraceae bacterium]|nr:PAS domain S-box protein [Rhodanobacteraceae bacterium]